MVRLIPKELKFFQLFTEVANNLMDGARHLHQLMLDPTGMAAKVEHIQEIEHFGDDMTHAIFTKLNQTFITPFDREDIHTLTSSLDDVLDFVNSAASRLILYKIDNPPAAAAELAGLIVQQTESLAKAVAVLPKSQGVIPHCVEINRLENEADRVSRQAIGHLFENERDPIQLIKIKELYEVLESATDKAEDAANVLETVALKSS
jgi:predicted phosphate transport protein (TIGR00153 family)